MKSNTLFINKMVCPRCVLAVENILRHELISFQTVNLGKVTLNNRLSAFQKRHLRERLNGINLEMIGSSRSSLFSTAEGSRRERSKCKSFDDYIIGGF